MSYTRDKDIMIRGVGAIAAIDAGNGRRARQRLMRKRVMERIDARRARLAFGPGRALPLNGTPQKLSSSAVTFYNTGVTYDPKQPSSMTTGMTSKTPTAPISPTTVVVSGGGGGSSMQTYPQTQAPLTPTPPKVPTIGLTPSAAGARPALTTQGGGGGAGVTVGPFTPIPTEPSSEPDIDSEPPATATPSSSGGMSTGKKVAIGVGVLALLYFATRD